MKSKNWMKNKNSDTQMSLTKGQLYLARAIQAFVMYCVNGTSRSSLLIESIDSMICIFICIY